MAAMRPGGSGRARAAAAVAAWRGVSGPAGLRDLAARIRLILGEWWRQEEAERRLFLWHPVAMALGVLLYFAAEGEPGLLAPAGAALIFAGFVLIAQDRRVARAAFIACACVALGFLAGIVRTLGVAAPRLERMSIATVAGFVEQVDFRPDGARIVLRPTRIEGVTPAGTPRRLRLVFRERPALAAGTFVELRARLLPPPEPARPGGYDFGRDAFFRGIGGVGSALGRATAKPAPGAAALDLRVLAAIDRARNLLTERIAGIVGGQAGALAAALVTGKRDLISERTNEDLRAAGLYHIVSISGLHMVLAAGAIFWGLRLLLAVALGRHSLFPIKKAAAAGAMAGATAYCLFTGAEVATERSLIMILVMLGAVLADRRALSMRNLAIAATLVLIAQPETLLGPSFQMSFAAVAGLISLAEWSRRRRDGASDEDLAGGPRWLRRLWIGFLGIVVTTVIASVATAPYAAYHFQRLNPLGLIGNALALPIVSIVVMPSAALGVLAYPFGLDRPVWAAMGFGVEPIILVSAWVAGLQGAVSTVAAFDAVALMLLSFGVVWLVLWASPLKYLGAIPLLAGIGFAAAPARPDLLVARTGEGAAIRAGDGRLAVVGNPSRFDIEAWLRADGDRRSSDDPTLRRGVVCDALGCVFRRGDGRTVAVLRDAAGFAEDCRRATVLVTSFRAPGQCAPAALIDRAALDRTGAAAYRFDADGRLALVAASRDARPRRPWEPRIVQQPMPDAVPAAAPPQAPARSDPDEDPRVDEAR